MSHFWGEGEREQSADSMSFDSRPSQKSIVPIKVYDAAAGTRAPGVARERRAGLRRAEQSALSLDRI